jgi:hypothetical protein
MAASGFTPIQLYRSATPGVVPLAGDLAVGELALNTADEKLYFKNSTGSVVSIGPGGTLTVARGGTGATTLTANNVILGNGTSAVQFVAPGTNGNILTSNGTTWTSAAAGVSLSGVTQSTTPFETSLGFEAGLNTTGASNTFVGYQSGKANTTGASNTAVGRGSLDANTTGAANSSVGSNALGSNTTGGDNTAIGASALFGNTTGLSNIAIGISALFNNVSGNYNTAVGGYALTTATGANCTAVGNDASRFNSTGAGNTTIGYQAGYSITTGSNNIVIGNTADATANNVNNEATIGNSSIATLRCQVTTITSLSDARDKSDVADLDAGLAFVNALRPVRFTWDMRDGGKVGEADTGFIAQDLQAAMASTGVDLPGLVYDINPDKLEAGYGKLLPVLVRAIQELSAEVATLKAARGIA